MSKIRVLVVDDSIVVRKVITTELNGEPDIEVIGTASNGSIALQRLTQLNPDLVILDIEMPDMDGLTALRRMRQTHPKTRVIMFSSLTEKGAKETLEALALGASDYFAKPTGAGGLAETQRLIRESLAPSIRALCPLKSVGSAALSGSLLPSRGTDTFARSTARLDRVDIVAIGASTGGPNALADLFATLPADFPVPIVIVQHMPPMFTKLLGERLARLSPIGTSEATGGEELLPRRALIAPGDQHMVVVRDGLKNRVMLHREPPENSCRPAVDPLFRSVASLYGPRSLGVILTGMGKDGLRGSQAIDTAGGQILAQDEASSVVWGMPGFVAKAGIADKVLPLSEIGLEILRRVKVGRG
jgi:two-component system chemotaxis response regulator CheB